MFQISPVSSKLFTVYCFSSFLCSVHFLPQVTYFFLIFMFFFDSESMSGLFECCRDIECASIFGEFRNIGNGFNFFLYHLYIIFYYILTMYIFFNKFSKPEIWIIFSCFNCLQHIFLFWLVDRY